MLLHLEAGVVEHPPGKQAERAFVVGELHSVEGGFTLGHHELACLDKSRPNARGRRIVASLAVSRAWRYASRDEPALRTDEDQRLRTHVRPCRAAWRREPRPRLSRFRLAAGNPRGGRQGGGRRIEPICAVSGVAAAEED